MFVPTCNRTPEPSYESSPSDPTLTNYGLIVAAHEHATQCGFFSLMAQHLKVPIKTVDYSVVDKVTTLWASILVGCRHTSDINTKLGTREPALAALFGLTRFPDQSTINRFLTALPEPTIAAVRRMHLELLLRNTRARHRRLRTKLARGHGRVLFVDLDQRGLLVASTRYELAAAGHFGAKRGRRGYKLSLAFLGGQIGEVLDEFFDPGNSPAGTHLHQILDTLERVCRTLRLPHDRVILRADALYGTPAILAQIQARGFGFLIKGISPQRARRLAGGCEPEAFVASKTTADGQGRFVADLGQQTLKGSAPKGAAAPAVQARVIVMRWDAPGRRGKARAGAEQRAREAARQPPPPRTCYSMLMTSLSADALPLGRVLETYDDRATIERYFRDETDALGAHSVRTHRHTGAAVFEWIVAMTSNLLRWMKAKLFAGTAIAAFGIGRLIGQVIAISARIVVTGTRRRVIVSTAHPLAKILVAALTAPVQLPLPLRVCSP